ncbi:hypothetical protein BDV37DRAFT_247576 [Aspergillus pseudonomiae]|uniref:Uncharacterized protein n=1 Tax=Aspergillus pseudonomiae TaxID=1506151 RepID=A0A5N7DFU8_9EURO|nr:uncharacterized protein BDV37DRAFT_247576 [Aspergillus pseudonomiae]KAE8404528.1 hypothetical protein BDV37DRAFT_247576 [Aspergillus pseudonomiae]
MFRRSQLHLYTSRCFSALEYLHGYLIFYRGMTTSKRFMTPTTHITLTRRRCRNSLVPVLPNQTI